MEKKLAWVTCLTALPLANALKLTPIQPSTQRVDLATESRNTAIALTNALYKIEQGEVPLEHSQQMLESPEMQKLQGVVRRWISMEEKLRNAITPGSTQQVQLFQDIIHNIASIRALLGHLLMRAHDDELALDELEQSCPTLWKYKASWRSLESDGWLDCYSSMAELYLKNNRLDEALRVERSLINSIPWIHGVYKDSPEHAIETAEDYEVIREYMSLPQEDRKQLGYEIKNAWALAEGIRGSFKMLVEDFISADNSRTRLAIYLRAQKVTKDILEQYLTEDPTAAPSTSSSSSAHVPVASGPSTTATIAETYRVDLLKVRHYLHREIKKETELFLRIMVEIVEKGDAFLLNMTSKDESKPLAKTTFESLQAEFEEELHKSARVGSDVDGIAFRDPGDIVSIFRAAMEKRNEKAALLLASNAAAGAQAAAAAEQQQQQSSHRAGSAKKARSKSSSSSTKSSNERAQKKSSSQQEQQAQQPAASKKSTKKVIESLTWAQYLLNKLYTIWTASFLTMIISIAGGYYLKIQRQQQVHLRHQAKTTKQSQLARKIHTSLLVPPPKFEVLDDLPETQTTWQVVLESIKIFWSEVMSKTKKFVWSSQEFMLSIVVLLSQFLSRKSLKQVMKSLTPEQIEAESSAASGKIAIKHPKRHRKNREETLTIDTDSTVAIESRDEELEAMMTEMTTKSSVTKHASKKRRRTNHKKVTSKFRGYDDKDPSLTIDTNNHDANDDEEEQPQESPLGAEGTANGFHEEKARSEDGSYDMAEEPAADGEEGQDEDDDDNAEASSSVGEISVDAPPTHIYSFDYEQDEAEFGIEGEWIEATPQQRRRVNSKKESPTNKRNNGSFKSNSSKSQGSAGSGAKYSPSCPIKKFSNENLNRVGQQSSSHELINTKTPTSTAVSLTPVSTVSTAAGKSGVEANIGKLVYSAVLTKNLSAEEQQRLKTVQVQQQQQKAPPANQKSSKPTKGQARRGNSSNSTNTTNADDGEHSSLSDYDNSNDLLLTSNNVEGLLPPSLLQPPQVAMPTMPTMPAMMMPPQQYFAMMHHMLFQQQQQQNGQAQFMPPMMAPPMPPPMPPQMNVAPPKPPSLIAKDRSSPVSYDEQATALLKSRLLTSSASPERATPSSSSSGLMFEPLVMNHGAAASMQPLPSPPSVAFPGMFSLPPSSVTVNTMTMMGGNGLLQSYSFDGRQPSPLPPLSFDMMKMNMPTPPLGFPNGIFFPAGMPPMQMVAPPSMHPGMMDGTASAAEVTDFIRRQIEYYFSAQNLEKDRYLRSIMDIDGYVVLNEIAKFRRISGMHPTHEMVIRAVESSSALEFVIDTSANASAEEKLMKTKVRGRDNPTRWVLSGGETITSVTNNGSSMHV